MIMKKGNHQQVCTSIIVIIIIMILINDHRKEFTGPIIQPPSPTCSTIPSTSDLVGNILIITIIIILIILIIVIITIIRIILITERTKMI